MNFSIKICKQIVNIILPKIHTLFTLYSLTFGSVCVIIDTESEGNLMEKIYLASPFFNEAETKIYNEVIKILRSQHYNVFVPREHTIPNGWDLPNHIWAENVFSVDYLALTQSDIVIVLNFGMYSDSGTAWECGCAYGMGKKVVNVLCGDESTEYSLMMLNGTEVTITIKELEDHLLSRLLQFCKTLNTKHLQK